MFRIHALNPTILCAALTVAVVSVATPPLLRAQPQDTAPGLEIPLGRPGLLQRVLGPLFPILRRLQVTPDERQQIQQMLQGHRDEIRALEQRLIEARRPLFAAVYVEPFDEGTIRDRSATAAAVAADAAVLRATVRTEIFAVLTPDQQTRAMVLLKRFELRHRADGDAP